MGEFRKTGPGDTEFENSESKHPRADEDEGN